MKMETRPQSAAAPIIDTAHSQCGLTKLEWFAGMALASRPADCAPCPVDAAAWAVAVARTVIDELNR
jgi:hypothetical protein